MRDNMNTIPTSHKRLAIWTVLIAGVLGITTNAEAYLHPKLGRFVQRDPIGYHDGMNVYEYVRSSPTSFVDPTGTVIDITCKARKVFPQFLQERSVTGYVAGHGTYFDEYSGEKTQFNMGVYGSEIVGEMIRSKREFNIKGDTAWEALSNLKKHIRARQNIVNAAKTRGFAFEVPPIKVNDIFWGTEAVKSSDGEFLYHQHLPHNSSDVFSAIENIWIQPDEYAMPCLAAVGMVQLRGISLAMLQPNFNAKFNALSRQDPLHVVSWLDAFIQTSENVTNDADWVPGDWGYVQHDTWDEKTVGLQGENVIYLGNQLWWGHISPREKPTMISLEKWIEKVKSWTKDGKGKASIAKRRRYPKLGLRIPHSKLWRKIEDYQRSQNLPYVDY